MNSELDTTYDRPPRALALAAFTSSVDRFGVSPLLVLIAHDFGVPLSLAIMTAAVYFLTYGVSQPVWGALSDKFGRLQIMRYALLGALLCGLLSAFATDLIVLTVLRSATGAFFGAIIPASITYVGDTTSVANRQSALSDLMAAVAVGTAFATAAAGAVGDMWSWRFVFAASAIMALVSLFALRRVPAVTTDNRLGLLTALRLFFTERWAIFVAVLAFVEGALVLGLLTLLAPALELQGVETALAGLSVAAYGVATLGFSRLVRHLTMRFSMAKVVALGGGCLITGLSAVAVHLSITTVVVAAVLFGASWAFMHTGLQSWATQVVPRARGMAVAIFAGALFTGSAVSSAAAGALSEAGRWGLVFGAGAVVAVVLTVVAVVGIARYQAQASSS